MMKQLKRALTAALVLVSASAFAARDYVESGPFQCTAPISQNSEIVLFVNGIGNSLDDAEQSRVRINALISPQCATCEFKKVYNQEDGLLDDVSELNLVGGWQLKAIDKAALAQFDFLVRDLPNVFTALKSAGYANYGGYKLDELKEALMLRLKMQRDLARSGYQGTLVRYYDPQAHGASFASALIAQNDKAIDNAKTLFDNPTLVSQALTLYKSYLSTYKSAIDLRFSTDYRRLVTATYYSDRNLYQVDTAASGAMTKSVESLTTILNEYVLAGHKVVVVAHSQGNHVIDLAYASLAQSKSAAFMQAIRVVGVASVSSTTPSNVYMTWDEDHTVLNLHAAGGNSPLQPNYADESPWYGFWDDGLKDHSFLAIYLSDALRGKFTLPANALTPEKFSAATRDATQVRIASALIKDLIVGSIDAAIAMPPTIVTGSLITAQIRWEDYDDMDFHILEPDANLVSFRNEIGTHGFLDLDDTDGLGPEHYYTKPAVTCDNIEGKTWKFLIQQYPNGGYRAAVHVLIKLGDAAFISRSFGLANWPRDALQVGTVRFFKEGTTLKYEMTITDPNG